MRFRSENSILNQRKIENFRRFFCLNNHHFFAFHLNYILLTMTEKAIKIYQKYSFVLLFKWCSITKNVFESCQKNLSVPPETGEWWVFSYKLKIVLYMKTKFQKIVTMHLYNALFFKRRISISNYLKAIHVV